ncbi:roadblock/LC7 domain-containing protein [Flavobacterium sp. WC2509]|uniref:roadblock/LC7 domain-containing protein n=1 Tax=Flavobacterium sp. WC2509 TaxID=3461406 RepID=UPI004044035A
MDLKKLENTGLETALVFDKNGDVIDSFKIEYPINIAAMSNVIFTMCKEMLEDMKFSDLKQIVLKTDSGLLIGNKFDDNLFLITTTNDISKLGLLLKGIDNLVLKT